MDTSKDLLRYVLILFRLAFVMSMIILSCILLYYVTKYAYPFIISFCLAFLINPVVTKLEQKTILSRGLSTFFVISLILLCIAGFAALLAMEVIDGLSYLTEVIPHHVETMIHGIQEYFRAYILPLWNQINEIIHHLSETQQSAVHTNLEQLGTRVAGLLSDLGTGVVKTLTHIIVLLPSLVTVMIVIFLSTFFICKDWYKLSALIESKCPDSWLDKITQIRSGMRSAFMGYIKAQIILVSFTGVTVLIGLMLLQVKHFLTISILSLILDIIPYLGTGTILLPWIIYEFVTGNYPLTIGLCILYAITILQRQLIEPKILSNSLGLNPLAILISLFVGYKLFGFVGLIAGPILLILLRVLADAGVFNSIWHYIIGQNPTVK